MGSEAPKRAGYRDVLDAPEHLVAEVIDGTLYTQPRPRLSHARAASTLGGGLELPFGSGNGGPGGWSLLDEPELHLSADIVVPDLAGWRRSTLPELPDAAFLSVRPDWACEVLSPSTQRTDRVLKMPLYRREGVPHVWLIDPDAKTLEVYRLDGENYRLLDSYADDVAIRAEPFDAIALELGALWKK
jgi:Uma2 family endonuclease